MSHRFPRAPFSFSLDLVRVLSLLGAFAMLSCASQNIAPPPAHPVIEGKSKSLSRADIRIVLDIVRKDLVTRYGSAYPIYTVRVSDHDHIDVCYGLNDIYTCAVLWRVKGKWTLQPFEKVDVPNPNIPVG
jgi:hypothetical protein